MLSNEWNATRDFTGELVCSSEGFYLILTVLPFLILHRNHLKPLWLTNRVCNPSVVKPNNTIITYGCLWHNSCHFRGCKHSAEGQVAHLVTHLLCLLTTFFFISEGCTIISSTLSIAVFPIPSPAPYAQAGKTKQEQNDKKKCTLVYFLRSHFIYTGLRWNLRINSKLASLILLLVNGKRSFTNYSFSASLIWCCKRGKIAGHAENGCDQLHTVTVTVCISFSIPEYVGDANQYTIMGTNNLLTL